MNLGQIIGELMRAADLSHLSELGQPRKSTLPDPEQGGVTSHEHGSRQKWGQGKYRKVCLDALRGKSLTVAELHAEVGGNIDSLRSLLPMWLHEGRVQRYGKRTQYRYSAPALEDVAAT